MFTGLVSDVGVVVSRSPLGDGVRLTIRTAYDLDQVEQGASIACDGVCLTAETFGPDTFTVAAGKETLDRTTAGSWRPGRRLHLEQALRVGDRLGGHIVQGHVDGVGRTVSIQQQAESWVIWIQPPRDIGRYLVEKGSVTVDGVSLTVNEVRSDGSFRINIIPHTITATHLGDLRAGTQVNLEVDVIARYVERLLTPSGGGLTLERLAELGYGRQGGNS